MFTPNGFLSICTCSARFFSGPGRWIWIVVRAIGAQTTTGESETISETVSVSEIVSEIISETDFVSEILSESISESIPESRFHHSIGVHL